MRAIRRLGGPLVLAMVLIPLLAACGPDLRDESARISAAVGEMDGAVDGAAIGYSSSGSSTVLGGKLYIPSAGEMPPEQLADLVVEGLELLWFESSSEPDYLRLGIVAGPMPDNPGSTADIDRFPEVGQILQADSTTGDGSFEVTAQWAQKRFGVRPDR